MLQSGAGDSQLTTREMLAAQASYYADPRDPDEVLELVGLTEKAGVRGKALSGGQRRRLDVALGIVGRPTLLFLDEPTTGFDPEARRQFWSLIRSLRELGTTMLLTTHYLDEAEALADRVGVITRGSWWRWPSRRCSADGRPLPPSSAGPRTAPAVPRPRRRRLPSCATSPRASPARSRTSRWPGPPSRTSTCR
ncbi:ABC transporter ATP-binding protein [Blastococcus brunescens]|uniref:ABC transporter ATP-binding protein n=1 Tax=Blastococcus brunescens TaxID=1564165 RepID=A0ABZ1B1S7_9ACTN|nr:ABC transporter ATP-binding protein [Blastococcus sp. BMG 8361]WRL62980.1 ABC transporter ATP-binding protein [Blastococcus sp. BMG 8361]